jgi:multiple sugar transport system permease protein
LNPAAPSVRAESPSGSRRPAGAPGRPRSARDASRDRRARYRRAARLAFLIPAGLYVLFAFVVPVIYNLILSFEVTTPATIASLFAPWAGLSNYKVTLLQSVTQSALVRTLTFTVLSLIFQFLIGFGLALLFNLKFPLNRLARSLVIVPWLLPFLVTGFIFRFLFQLEAGAVNQVLLDVHLIHQPIGYLLSPGWAYVTVLITNIWLGVPFFTVLLYSALQDVPPELKEAAMIDGAGPWQTLVRVTLPVIRPVIEVTFVLGFVFTVKVFDIVISLTQGGPANSTQLIATWAYNLSFQQFDYGAGAALNTVLLIIALLVAPIYIRLNRDSLRQG